MAHAAYGLHETQMFGDVYPDTKPFNDVEALNLDPHYSHIEEIQVQYDDLVYGIVVTYHKAPGTKQILHHLGNAEGERHIATLTFDPDEYVVHISGRQGNVYDHLKIITNKGKTIDVGGDHGEPFSVPIPPNHTILGFRGGLGGHLHNLSFVLRPAFAWDPHSSNKAGNVNPDTRPWDDLHLLQGAHFAQITAIRASSVGPYVSGISVTYLVNGKETKAGEWHQGSETEGEKVVKKIKLVGNEFIAKVECHSGNLIDRLKITTSNGQVLEVGGSGGIHHIELNVPEGHRIVAFGGGTNGHLHNLYVHYN